MSKDEMPMTPGVRWLKAQKVEFIPLLYPYEEHGGTRHAAECLHVNEHQVIKTLVLETEAKKPLVVLMHGDREVSLKQMARVLGVKTVTACEPGKAERLTGYMVGGISPFGVRSTLTIYVEGTIFQLERLFINGGKRGFLVELTPAALRQALPGLKEVFVAVE